MSCGKFPCAFVSSTEHCLDPNIVSNNLHILNVSMELEK